MKEVFNTLDPSRLKETVKLTLIHIFAFVAAICFAMVLCINFSMKKHPFVVAFWMLVLFAAIMGIYKLVMKLKFNEKIVIPIFLVVYFIAAYFMGTNLKVFPAWDFGTIYEQAVKIVSGDADRIELVSYFLRYPNNQCCFLIVLTLFKIGTFFNYTDYLTLGLGFNALVLAVSLGILYLCIKKIWNKNVALFGLILSMGCCIYVTYVPIFYTDTFSLPLMNLLLLGYIYIFKQEEMRKKSMIVALITALILGFAFELRATAIIFGVAMFIHIFLSQNFKKAFIFTVILVLGFYASMKTYHVYYNQTDILQYTSEEYDYYNFPYSQWIMMGLKNPGGFDRNDKNYMISLPTYALRVEQSRLEIARRLANYGLNGFLDHLRIKIAFTWSTGDYWSIKLLNRHIVHPEKTWLTALVRDEGGSHEAYRIYVHAMAYLMILLLIISLIFSLFDNSVNFITVLQLAMFGIFLFLLLWESKPKYLVNFLPALYICAIDAVIRLDQLFSKLLKQTKFLKKGD